MSNPRDELQKLVELSQQAGEAIMKIYESDEAKRVTSKEDGSPLTLADQASHKVIIEGLKNLYPQTPVISEEGKLPSYEERKEWNEFFLVDPLDGTKEFIKRNGEFTTNIALLKNGTPVIGVVFAPAKGLMYAASSELGSFQVENNEWKPLTSTPKDPRQGVRVVESRSHGAEWPEKLQKLINVKERVASGSSLKICLLADGSADVYPRLAPTMEWDVAAGDCVFRYSGKDKARHSPLTYNKETLKNSSFVLGIPEEDQDDY